MFLTAEAPPAEIESEKEHIKEKDASSSEKMLNKLEADETEVNDDARKSSRVDGTTERDDNKSGKLSDDASDVQGRMSDYSKIKDIDVKDNLILSAATSGAVDKKSDDLKLNSAGIDPVKVDEIGNENNSIDSNEIVGKEESGHKEHLFKNDLTKDTENKEILILLPNEKSMQSRDKDTDKDDKDGTVCLEMHLKIRKRIQ